MRRICDAKPSDLDLRNTQQQEGKKSNKDQNKQKNWCILITQLQGALVFVVVFSSIKIFDLAKNLILLSGLKYPDDIDIKIIGLRPGEKIYEELLTSGENIKPTYHEKILIAKCEKVDAQEIEPLILDLCNISPAAQNIYIVSKIKELVPEYAPNNSKYEVLN